VIHLVAKDGYSVNVPDELSRKQIEGIRNVVHHGASTYNAERVQELLELQDRLRSAVRVLDLARSEIAAGRPEEADKWLKVALDRANDA